MYLRKIKIKNFRNYESATLLLQPGVSIITGVNASGKTNLLEAIHYVLCGRSFRTSREAEMVKRGASFMRLEAEVEVGGSVASRTVIFAPGSPVKVEPSKDLRMFDSIPVLCFTPDYLQLIKGPPAVRRRYLDESISKRSPAHRHLVMLYQKILSQRNSFLQRARAGLVKLEDITPWDRQLASMALKIYRARRDYCRLLAPHLKRAWWDIVGEESDAQLHYQSQIEQIASKPDPQGNVLRRLRDSWLDDMERTTTSLGIHRDDVQVFLEGKDLRHFGSQGEQRATVLALLLASRNLASKEGGLLPLVLLDDVMSELDLNRRRRLMSTLAAEGQVIITAADSGLFTRAELEGAAVYKIDKGRVSKTREGICV